MKLLVDATAVREHGGGLSTYATALITAWNAAFPDDHLVVVAGDAGGVGIMRSVTADVRVSLRGRSRFIAQQALVPVIAKTARPDAILSLVPGVPLLPVGVPIVSVVHDLRSWRRPDEFPIWVRAYRRVAHHHAFHRSDRIVAVSERSRLDLEQVCRRGALRTHVVHPAADHVDEWDSRPQALHVITFGHWSNKKPGLAIEAWAKALHAVDAAATPDWRLHVVGVPDGDRRALGAAAAELGVADSVLVHDYLPVAEYQRLFTSASAVLMLSTFEGFGLPVIEAMRRGVHVIASKDAALQEAGGSSAAYVDDQAGLVKALIAVLVNDPSVQSMVQTGLLRTRQMTWASTAAETRAVIQDAIAGGSGRPDRGS
jgi:glycosyltransferase involved in cell wall biosynthesis